jgi:hypothetical protein
MKQAVYIVVPALASDDELADTIYSACGEPCSKQHRSIVMVVANFRLLLWGCHPRVHRKPGRHDHRDKPKNGDRNVGPRVCAQLAERMVEVGRAVVRLAANLRSKASVHPTMRSATEGKTQ